MTFASSTITNFNYNQRVGTAPGTNSSLTWTVPAGTAYQSTATFQFGNAALYGSATGGYIQTTTTTTFMNVGTGDFTIEGWLYIPTARNTSLPGQNNGSSIDVIVNNATNGLGIRLGQTYQGNVNNISIFGRAGADQDYASYVWPLNQWNHFVAQRSGTAGGNANTQIAFWANGIKLWRNNGPGGTAVGRNFANSAAGGAITIGSYNSGSTDETLRNAYLDELSVTVGLARYDPQGNISITGNITTGQLVPPDTIGIVDSSTTLLMHFDAANGSTTFNNATS
jgi:hypothetical protein